MLDKITHNLKKQLVLLGGITLTGLTVLAVLSLPARADMDDMDDMDDMKHKGGYMLTITNMMDDELLAPVLVARHRYDRDIFKDMYVTAEAQEQILTGDPAMLAKRIGKNAIVQHGEDGPPGVLLAPGKSITISVSGRDTVRVIAMVAPTQYADHFVTALVNPKSALPVMLDRYDIGFDEGTRTITHVGEAAASVKIEPAM